MSLFLFLQFFCEFLWWILFLFPVTIVRGYGRSSSKHLTVVLSLTCNRGHYEPHVS